MLLGNDYCSHKCPLPYDWNAMPYDWKAMTSPITAAQYERDGDKLSTEKTSKNDRWLWLLHQIQFDQIADANDYQTNAEFAEGTNNFDTTAASTSFHHNNVHNYILSSAQLRTIVNRILFRHHCSRFHPKSDMQKWNKVRHAHTNFPRTNDQQLGYSIIETWSDTNQRYILL